MTDWTDDTDRIRAVVASWTWLDARDATLAEIDAYASTMNPGIEDREIIAGLLLRLADVTDRLSDALRREAQIYGYKDDLVVLESAFPRLTQEWGAFGRAEGSVVVLSTGDRFRVTYSAGTWQVDHEHVTGLVEVSIDRHHDSDSEEHSDVAHVTGPIEWADCWECWPPTRQEVAEHVWWLREQDSPDPDAPPPFDDEAEAWVRERYGLALATMTTATDPGPPRARLVRRLTASLNELLAAGDVAAAAVVLGRLLAVPRGEGEGAEVDDLGERRGR